MGSIGHDKNRLPFSKYDFILPSSLVAVCWSHIKYPLNITTGSYPAGLSRLAREG